MLRSAAHAKVGASAGKLKLRGSPGRGAHLTICAAVCALTRIFHTRHEPSTPCSGVSSERRRFRPGEMRRSDETPLQEYEISGLTLHLSPFPPRGEGARRTSRQFACHAAAPSPRP